MKFSLVTEKLIRGYLRVSSLFLLLIFTSLCQGQTLTEYSLFASIGDSDALVRLRVLPNGQIIDPNQQYGTLANTDGISLDMNRKYLYISCLGYGSPSGVCSFTIQDDGTLLSLETTICTGNTYRTTITPNNQLLFIYTSNSSYIYTMSSSGILYNTGNAFLGSFESYVNSQGNIAITPIQTPSEYYVYSIDYITKTLNLTETLPGAGTQIWGMSFPKSGNMGIVYGLDVDPANHDVSVLWIDSLGNVTTTNQNFSIYNEVSDAPLSPDDRYIFFCAVTTMYVYSVDTLNRTITNTGYASKPSNAGTPILFRINDSGTFGVLLYEATDGERWLATTFIDPSNGHLSWTGYTFPVDSIYAGAGATIDIQWVPVYTTSIPQELWKKLE